jgi:hypothetical protein
MGGSIGFDTRRLARVPEISPIRRSVGSELLRVITAADATGFAEA